MIVDGFHLTYCSNIHRGETWAEVSAALAGSLPRVREQLSVAGPLGVGLRLSAQAAETLEHGETLAAFKDFLRTGNYYVFTINGFPYGAFHGQRVKEQVYRPDWREPARVDYTNRLARLLAALLADRPEIEGSVSTVPGAFRSEVTSAADVDTIATRILQHARELVALRERTGITITLAIEPEPVCFIETVDDAIAFFDQRLFDAAWASRMGVSVEDVRRHVGICFDACHMAVEYEDPAEALRRFRDAGIRIGKVQISSALDIRQRDGAAIRVLMAPFAEDTYLHQVVERSVSGLTRYTDLPQALEGVEGRVPAHSCDWRVHFHVPIVLSEMSGFHTTQPYLEEVLDLLKRERACPYLEVETYTWDVLPVEYRTTDIATAIARELAWVRTQLEA